MTFSDKPPTKEESMTANNRLLHLAEFLISPSHIWRCVRTAKELKLSVWFGIHLAWWGQTGYDREPFTGPRWDKEQA